MSVKKLARTTKRIEDWRAKWTPSILEEGIADHLAELEAPDHSGLHCGALSALAGYYGIMAEYGQLHRGDTRICKENMYRMGWCQWAVCRWPDQEANRTRAHFDGYTMLAFHGAVIADADETFLKELGDLLRRPEYQTNFKLKAVNAMLSGDRALIALALGEDENVIRSQAEKALADLESLKSARKGAPVELRILLDILNGDGEALNEHLRESISYDRSSRDRVNFMDWHAIACAKIAMRRGMKVEVDTEDCPLSLSRPAEMDYSSLELPRPKYGFPWERQ